MAWHQNLHRHAHRGLLYLAEKHPIISGGIALVGGYVVVKKLTAAPTSAVPQNPAPQIPAKTS